MTAPQPGRILCGHCGYPIHRPEPGSYPPDVEWVHQVSAAGVGNRWCSDLRTTAAPATDGQEATR